MDKKIVKQIYKYVVKIRARQDFIERLYNISNTAPVSSELFDAATREITLLYNHIKLLTREYDLSDCQFKQLTKSIVK